MVTVWAAEEIFSLNRKSPGAGGGARGKKPGESASTAPSGLFACIKKILAPINQFAYHIYRAGRRSSSTNFEPVRWSVPAVSPGKFCHARRPPPQGFCGVLTSPPSPRLHVSLFRRGRPIAAPRSGVDHQTQYVVGSINSTVCVQLREGFSLSSSRPEKFCRTRRPPPQGFCGVLTTPSTPRPHVSPSALASLPVFQGPSQRKLRKC